MDERAERLRQLVGELLVGTSGARRRRVPVTLRAEVASYVRSERAAGTTWSRIAGTMGLSKITLRRWSERADEPRLVQESAVTPLRPVRVRDEARGKETGGLVLVLAQGARLEGLRLNEAITVVRALA